MLWEELGSRIENVCGTCNKTLSLETTAYFFKVGIQGHVKFWEEAPAFVRSTPLPGVDVCIQ